jgi:hypothetical protein
MTSLLKRDIPVRATLAVLALALLATAVTGREEDPAAPGVEPGAARTEAAPSESALPDIDLDKLQRRMTEDKVPDLFALRDPAPHKKIARPPPNLSKAERAALSVPPLPFTYLGQVLDGGKLAVFLAQGNEHYSVQAGQKIGEQYRVERIRDDAVVLTYLPLGLQQVLTIPVSN